MSIPVEVAELPAQISRFGPSALLVTTSGDGPPHVASVLVTVDGDDLVVPAGRKTRANAIARPAVTLVWLGAVPEHCLIVDGSAREGSGDSILVHPTSAVLHRLAQAPDGSDPRSERAG